MGPLVGSVFLVSARQDLADLVTQCSPFVTRFFAILSLSLRAQGASAGFVQEGGNSLLLIDVKGKSPSSLCTGRGEECCVVRVEWAERLCVVSYLLLSFDNVPLCAE